MGLNGDVKKRRFRKRGGAKKKKKTEAGTKQVHHGDAPTDVHGAETQDYERGASNYPSQRTDYSAYGNGTSTLDSNLLSYISKIQEDLNQMSTAELTAPRFSLADDEAADDELPPPPVLLARNALAELQSRIHEVAMDPSGSRILESLLTIANDEAIISNSLIAMLSLGSSRLAVLAQHRCGSHVLEALVTHVSSSAAFSPSVQQAMAGVVKALKDWDLNTLLSVMNNPCGSHVLRVLFASLSGLPVDEPRESKIDDSEPGKIRTYIERFRKTVPEEWYIGIQHTVNCLLSADNASLVEALPWQTASCTALQSLVSATCCFDATLAENLVKMALGNQLSTLTYHPCGSRFIERAVTCLGPRIVWNEVKDHICELIRHPKANFVAQRIFLGLKGRGQVMKVWDEVEDIMPELLGAGSARDGVVLALLKATEVEGDDVCQRRANRSVAKALGVTGKNAKDLIGVLLIGSMDGWVHWRETINSSGLNGLGVHGTDSDVLQVPRSLPFLSTIGMLAARCLLRYSGGAGQNARDSMATLTQLEILALAGNPVGSRLLEQWMDLDSPNGSPKNTLRFVNCIMSSGASVVCATARSPYGTQLLSTSIPRLPRNVQKQIMDVLASNVDELKEHRFGTIVVRKCRVEQYIRKGGEWIAEGSARETRQRIFADILNGKTDGEKTRSKKAKMSKKSKK